MKRKSAVILLLLGFFLRCDKPELVLPGMIITDEVYSFPDSVQGVSVFFPVRDMDSEYDKLRFFVQSPDGRISELPTTPDFGALEYIAAIAFRDINGDTRTDIIIVAQYTSGVGEKMHHPYPMPVVYIRQPNGWEFDSAFTSKFNMEYSTDLTISETIERYQLYLKN